MKFFIQRVSKAIVRVDGDVVGQIEKGLLVFVGIGKIDTQVDFDKISNNILNLRFWAGDKKGFDKSVRDVSGGVLIVSQFTLFGNVSNGLRPDFSQAMDADDAKIVYNKLVDIMKQEYKYVESGEFQAMMDVELINDGPVSLMWDMGNKQ